MLKAMLATGRSWLDEVKADSPLGLWLLQDASGTSMAATIGSAGTYSSSGISYQAGGPGKLALPYAADFGGTKGASVPVNLSGGTVATIECFLKVASWPATDGILFEYSSNYNSFDGLIIYTNATTWNQNVCSTGGEYRGITATAPGAGVWRHVVLTYDRVTPWPTNIYVDGVAQSAPPFTQNGAVSGAFSNAAVLYVMARALTSFPRAGQMAGLAVYGSTLSAARVAAHFAGA